MRAATERALTTARELLASEPAAIPFAVAVTIQLTGPAGSLANAPPSEEAALARRVAEIVLRAGGELDGDALVARLLEEPPLAAAFFQNVDLLYAHHCPCAEPVGALIMRAMEIASRADARR